ncbi:MAG: NAD-dependent epimerase/dehydratase family protein [Chloroflexaceae bacterium]|nr:NAD-dependent epimerase/dehydratase family protein [Chloroflexaceae bacterium]
MTDHEIQARINNTFGPRPTSYLVTGGAGFIGSHLVDALLAQGHHVLAIDNLSTGRFENISGLIHHPRFHFAQANITDDIVMDRLASQADIIIHLAAAVGVKLIVENPVHTIETNVMGTEAVLKAALRYQTRVLIASTSEVYGKGSSVPFREEDDVVLGPTSRNRWGYAASKMVDEFLALAYGREKGLPVTIFRLFNTVGPRQTGRYGMVIPRFVQQALQGERLTVYGDGTQSRCFLHVQDAIQAIMKMANSDSEHVNHEVFNVGSTEEISIYQLAQRILGLVGQPEENIDLIAYEDAYAAGFEDMRQRVPDISKIQQATGWQPSRSLEQILHDVIESYCGQERDHRHH